MFCAKCGTKILDDARYCLSCGASVEEQVKSMANSVWDSIPPEKQAELGELSARSTGLDKTIAELRDAFEKASNHLVNVAQNGRVEQAHVDLAIKTRRDFEHVAQRLDAVSTLPQDRFYTALSIYEDAKAVIESHGQEIFRLIESANWDEALASFSAFVDGGVEGLFTHARLVYNEVQERLLKYQGIVNFMEIGFLAMLLVCMRAFGRDIFNNQEIRTSLVNRFGQESVNEAYERGQKSWEILRANMGKAS